MKKAIFPPRVPSVGQVVQIQWNEDHAEEATVITRRIIEGQIDITVTHPEANIFSRLCFRFDPSANEKQWIERDTPNRAMITAIS